METQDKGMKKRGRPRTLSREITKSSQRGLREGYTRATFIISEDVLDKIKAIAYEERKEIKAVVDEALRSYLAGKDVKPVPAPQGRPYKGGA